MALTDEEKRRIIARARGEVLEESISSKIGSAASAVGRSTPVRWTLSTLGKTLDVLDTGLNAVTLGLKPIVTSYDPELEKVYQREGWNITPSALVEEAVPGKGIDKKVLKFIVDVLGDPLTYTGVGLTTKGRALAKAASAGKEGIKITAESKLGREIAKAYGEKSAGFGLIGEAKKGLKPTLKGQAEAGERALIKFAGIPIVKGAKVYEAFDTARNFTRQSKYGKAYRTLFSTHASNPEFDAMERNFINLLQYRKGEVYATTRVIEDTLNEMSQKLGIPREQINRMTTQLVERPSKVRQITKKVVTRVFPQESEIHQQLVNTLRAVGQEKAAKYWEKKGLKSKEFKAIFKEAKTPQSAIARLLERGQVYNRLAERGSPLKALVEDISFINESKSAKFAFVREISSIGYLGDELKAIDLNKVAINSKSNYIRRAYKESSNLDSDYVEQKLRDILVEDLEKAKVSTKDVFKDLFVPLETKLPTTKKVIGKAVIEEFGPKILPYTRFNKLQKKLEAKGLMGTTTSSEEIIDYYTTNFFRPKAITTSLDEMGTPVEAYKKFRKGQVAEILRTSRGDVYQKYADLVNQGIIENRRILPDTQLIEGITEKALYNEQEVLVKGAPEALRIPGTSRAYQYSKIPRGLFEQTISEVKALLYKTNQILPVIHGTKSLDRILESGALKGGAAVGAGTQARDYAAGQLGKIFATTAETSEYFGPKAIVLPINVLRDATALPGDGLYFPANAMITKHLLTRGEDGIVDMGLRHVALQDWNTLEQLRNSLLEDPADKGVFARALSRTYHMPDIHITAPIPTDQFLGVVPVAKQSVDDLLGFGMDISRMQLVDRNGRFIMKFFDKGGNPLIEQELLAAPNIAEMLSKSNLVGVAVDAEAKAAAVEKLLAKAKIPQGESVYTYLRKTQPQLINPHIQPVEAKEFQEILDNYGLLSDESIDAIAANVLEIREGLMGQGLSAETLMKTPVGQGVSTKILLNNENFSKTLRDLPGYSALPTEEKGRLSRMLFKQVKAHERGHNMFTMGLRILPSELQEEWADLAARATHLDIMRKTPSGKVMIDQKLSEVLRTYSAKGEDPAIEQLIGKRAFARIQKAPIEHEHMKSVVRKMVGHVDELFAEAHSIYQINPKKLRKIWPEAFTMMQKIYSRRGWKTEWIKENTMIPHKWATKYPEIFDVAQKVRKFMDDTFELEVSQGVRVARMAADGRGTLYTRHVFSKEAQAILKAKYFRGARVWTDEMQAQIMRKFRRMDTRKIDEALARKVITAAEAQKLRRKGGLKFLDEMTKRKENPLSQTNANSMITILTVDEVNVLGRKEGGLKILGGQKVDQFFDPDPVTQVKVRGLEGARALTGHEYFQATKQFGIQTKTPPVGHRLVKAEALKGWSFPDEIADHIDRYYELTKLPAGLNPFIDMFDTVQDTWKAWTLSIFPAYHTRNIVGNTWNNFLAGLVNPAYYNRAWNNLWDELNKRNLDNVIVNTGYGEKYTLRQVIDLMKRHDVWKVGQYGRDIDDLFEKELTGAFKLLRDNKALETGRRIGTFLEAQSYMAHFLWRLEQGYSPGAAAQSVKKYLFDYADLTDFERKVMKRIFPFYTWTRKNIPIQLEAIVTQPGKPLGVLKAKTAYETNQDGAPDERYLPDWFVQNFPIRARKNNETGNFEYFLLGSWLPLADIDKIFMPHRLIANMLTPLAKEPLQQLANYDFFTNNKIDKGGEYERLVGLNMPKRVAHILRNVRLLSELDKITKKDLSIESKAFGLITGKLYPYDEIKSREFKANEFEEGGRNLSSQLKKAHLKGDVSEAKRVIKAIQTYRKKQAEFYQSR